MKNIKKSNQCFSVFIGAFLAISLSACSSGSDPIINDEIPIEEPANNAPVITSTALTEVNSDELYSYTLTATDADNDAISMAATGLPSWLTFDSGTGLLTGTPSADDAGDHDITLSASDGTDSTVQAFTITVTAPANNAPTITSNAVVDAVVDTAYSYTLTATDADDDALTMSASPLPDWLTFDAATGILAGTPSAADIGDHAISLSVTDGTDSDDQPFTINVTEATSSAAELVIFDDAERADWPAWDCCGGSTPTLVTDSDTTYAEAMEFSIGATATVMGFTSRDADGAVGGTPFDASDIAVEGTLVFDLKMTGSPGATDWKLKLESNNAATAVEVNLSSSQEAHAEPVLDTWQRYTFNLADLSSAGLDMSAIDVVMIFPAWGSGDGAVYRIDNLKFLADGASSPSETSTLVIFDDTEKAEWPAWDCCGGTTPAVVTDTDAAYGAAMEFSIGATATVMGFTSRNADGAVDGVPFNASSISANGTLVFDLKMTASPGATDWKLKVESNNAATFVEVNLSSAQQGHVEPVLDTWQRYTFNLADLSTAGLDMNAIDVVMIFPAWGTGDGAVYRIDNVKFLADGNAAGSNGSQVDLPINFDDEGVNYTTIDFGGNVTILVADPVNAANGMVAQSTKTDAAEAWAGTTMSTNDGLATAVPLTLTDSIMKVWVYSPDAGIPVRLKLENHLDPTQTVETEALTTMVNTWEELTFDFTNEAPGTEPLNPALHPDWIFDKASIFFNFATDGATAGEKTYYWDDVSFGD